MTVGNSEAEFGEWSPPGAAGPWKEPMYREKANPVEMTEMPMVIPRVKRRRATCGMMLRENAKDLSRINEHFYSNCLHYHFQINERLIERLLQKKRIGFQDIDRELRRN